MKATNQQPTILLVDDEQKLLDLLSFRLQLLGYRVITATSGEDGFSLAEEHHPDLIILDLTLPDEDGLTVCGRLTESETLGSVPVLMLTARSELEDADRAMAAGARDYMVKPYDPAVLQAKIRRLLGSENVASTRS